MTLFLDTGHLYDLKDTVYFQYKQYFIALFNTLTKILKTYAIT